LANWTKATRAIGGPMAATRTAVRVWNHGRDHPAPSPFAVPLAGEPPAVSEAGPAPMGTSVASGPAGITAGTEPASNSSIVPDLHLTRAPTPSTEPDRTARTVSKASATVVYPAKVPRLVADPDAWSKTEVARTAPRASIWVACIQVDTPPGWVMAIGMNQAPMATAPATTALAASRTLRTEPATAKRASTPKDWTADCRNPAASPSDARAAAPCQECGRARHARLMRRGAIRRSNE
jgi:hypothetical protein